MNEADAAARWTVIEPWIPENAVGAELGVFKGHLSGHLLKRSPKRLYLVDPWYRQGPVWNWVKVGDPSTVTAFIDVVTKFRGEMASGQVIPIVDHSVPFLDSMPAASFDFCNLDSSHQYDMTLEELRALRRAIKARRHPPWRRLAGGSEPQAPRGCPSRQGMDRLGPRRTRFRAPAKPVGPPLPEELGRSRWRGGAPALFQTEHHAGSTWR